MVAFVPALALVPQRVAVCVVYVILIAFVLTLRRVEVRSIGRGQMKIGIALIRAGVKVPVRLTRSWSPLFALAIARALDAGGFGA